MKQYFAILAILFTAILSSCSNDDIETIESGELILNISTQSVYDGFNITNGLKTKCLEGKGYSIGVYSFIYDQEGNLAASDSTYVETFGQVTQEFNHLKDGDYTLVTLEMIIKNDNNCSSLNWLIVGQDRLETIAIMNKRYTSYWYSAVGLYTENLSFSSGNLSKSVTPKGIGCLVFTSMDNFDRSHYVKATLFTKDQPAGRLLSPKYSSDERFIYYKHNEPNVWSPRGYVYNEDGLKNHESPDIYLLEEGRIRYCFGAETTENLNKKFLPCPSSNSTFLVKDGLTYSGGYIYIGGNEGSDCKAGMFDTYQEYKKWYNDVIANLNNTNYVKQYHSLGASASQVNTYMINASLQLSDPGSDNKTTVY